MRRMLINAQRADELRVAIVTDGTLDDYQVAVATAGLTRGNVYRGVVASVHPGLDAAFVEYGAARHGMLARHDVVAAAQHRTGEGKKHARIEHVLERGKPVLVQVTREPVGTKGAALTTNLSFAGRYLVFMPFDDTRAVSRKVEDEALRTKLRELADGLPVPEGCGVIVRTNAADQNKTALNRDLAAILRIWKQVRAESTKGKGAKLLYSDQDLIVQAVRDYLDSSINEVLVDDDHAFEQAYTVMRSFMPRAKTRLVRYKERLPLFSRFNLEQQIESIFKPRVELPAGGSIVIESTEALTAIDVNSGRSLKGSGEEDTAFRTNREAAPEVARQLRLRDIGGLIVVDFIDMRAAKHRKEVEKTMRDALKTDRARTTVGRISDNGLLEINRQRIRAPLVLRTHRPCPTCGGMGKIPSPETVSTSLLRRIEERAATGGVAAVSIALHPELADALQNNYRQELAALEREFGIDIEVVAATSLHRSEEQVRWTEGEPRKTPQPAAEPAAAAEPAGAAEPVEEEPPAPTAAEPPAAPAPRARKRRRGGRKHRRKGGEPAAADAAAPGGAVAAAAEEEGDEAFVWGIEDDESAPEAETAAVPEAAPAAGEEPGAEPSRPRGSRRRRRGGRRHRRRPAGNGGPDAAPAPAEPPPSDLD